jgi:hypothetical protein
MPEKARDSPVHRLPDWRLTLPLAQSCRRCGARALRTAETGMPRPVILEHVAFFLIVARPVTVGGVGDAGKTEGQPHASPAELATDTLGQSRLARFRLPNASDIHTTISGYATKIVVRATDDELIVRRSGN